MFYLLILLPALLFQPLLYAQPIEGNLSLQEAVELAFRVDNNLEAARSNLKAAEHGIKSARAAYFPKLFLTSSYSRISKVNEISFSIPQLGLDQNIKIGTENPFNANLGLNYEIYSFGRRPSTVKLSRVESKSSELNYKLIKKKLFDIVARAYLAAVFARESLNLIRIEQDRSTQIYQLVERRYNQELAPEFDLLQMKLRFEQYSLAVLEAANNDQTARLNLARLLNIPVDQLPELEDNMGGDLFSLPAYADQAELMEHREDYIQAKAATDMAALAGKIKKSTYFPNISLFGAYDLRNGYQPDVGKVEDNFSIGVSLNWLLFDGFARRAEISKQNYLEKASVNLADDLKLAIPFQVKSAQLALENNMSRIGVGEQALVVAQKAMSIARTRYDLGDISMIELLEVENQLSESELGLLKLKYEYMLGQLDLKLAGGYYPEIDSFN